MVSGVPAVVIAAPASGSGKTTVATGLIGALRAAGHRVAPFKVGPDFIDPGYHAVAAGRPGRNLDPNLVGENRIAALFASGAAGCDIAVVEGVMGLFDGRIVDDQSASTGAYGSTAHVAALLGAPVVLVVDASGHSQTLAAILHGLRGFDAAVDIGGVVLNRVGSARHESVLRQACAQVGLPVLGVLRRAPELAVPSRHLGLIPAVEHGTSARGAVGAMADMIGASLDLDGVVALARGRSGSSTTSGSAAYSPDDEIAAARAANGLVAPGESVRIAVAGGAAFTFGYAEHAELLAAAGAQVITVDPLHDERLPDDTDALVVGGGFPEEHVHQLAANASLRQDIRAHATAGRPVQAECAGLLYLAHDLDGHPMAGVLDVHGHFGPTLTLGYRDAVAVTDSVLYHAGERVTGHEFHRSVVEAMTPASAADGTPSAWRWRRDASVRDDGVVVGAVHASYLHTHPAGVPASVARLVAAAEAARSRLADLEAAR